MHALSLPSFHLHLQTLMTGGDGRLFSLFLHLRHPPVEGLGAVRRRKEPGKRSFARGNPPFKGIFYPCTSGGSSTAAGAQPVRERLTSCRPLVPIFLLNGERRQDSNRLTLEERKSLGCQCQVEVTPEV